MELKRVDLGRDVAEFDQHLAEYFITTSTYEEILSGKRGIITGRKGAGKTALLKYCRETENPSFQYVVTIEATHATLVKIDETLKSYTTQVKNLDSGFKLGWLFSTLLALIDRLTKETSFYVTGEEKKLYEFAKDNLAFSAADPIAAIAQYTVGWVRNLKSLGPFERDTVNQPEGLPFDEVRILELIKAAVQRINAKGKTVYLFYDKLDERWDSSDLYIAFLQGLLLATKDIRATGLKVFPVVLLRDDIFASSVEKFQHLDHFRTQIKQILWSEEELAELIGIRIRTSLLKQGLKHQLDKISNADAWDLIFCREMPAKKKSIPTRRYMIERTLYRPRDIIVFVGLALDAAVRGKAQMISVDDIRAAEITYSEGKFHDLCAELANRWSGIQTLLEKFRKGTMSYDMETLQLTLLDWVDELKRELDWLHEEPAKLVQFLYSIGFLAYPSRGGAMKGSRIIHSGIEPNSNTILEQERVHVSPIYRKALSLRDH